MVTNTPTNINIGIRNFRGILSPITKPRTANT
jgi:hypothetical protein